MNKKLTALVLAAAAALPLFAGGEQEAPAPFNDHALVAVHRIHLREVVRIGVDADNAPFSYVDDKGVWQGYDVYFARRIAKEILGDKEKYLRLIPVRRETWADCLERDEADIVLGFGGGPEAASAEFALPYRRVREAGGTGETLVAAAVRKGNGELRLWLNDVIRRRIEDTFFHQAYEATLRPVYGAAVEPDAVVIERGGTEP